MCCVRAIKLEYGVNVIADVGEGPKESRGPDGRGRPWPLRSLHGAQQRMRARALWWHGRAFRGFITFLEDSETASQRSHRALSWATSSPPKNLQTSDKVGG